MSFKNTRNVPIYAVSSGKLLNVRVYACVKDLTNGSGNNCVGKGMVTTIVVGKMVQQETVRMVLVGGIM